MEYNITDDYEEQPMDGWVHEDDLPDLDHAKDMLISVRNALYETGDIENLKDCLEELLSCFNLPIPKHQPIIERNKHHLITQSKENHMSYVNKTDSSKSIHGFSADDIKSIKTKIDPQNKFSDANFNNFLYVCNLKKLDPRMNQIYAIPRGNSMTIETSIDGFRLIAERTGKYAPGKSTDFNFDDKGKLISATSFIKKLTDDGTWHEVSATAFLVEYQSNSTFWNKMPSVMLEKCSESRALRRAFPGDFSGLYSEDEMSQAKPEEKVVEETTSGEEADYLEEIIGDNEEYREKVMSFLKTTFGRDKIEGIPSQTYKRLLISALKMRKEQIELDNEVVEDVKIPVEA